eukprot:m.92164 g.92164  ORF g.92164 m.92164 type:complete len:52 (+) comp26527_c0_seq1:1343-1498(+)
MGNASAILATLATLLHCSSATWFRSDEKILPFMSAIDTKSTQNNTTVHQNQ